MEPDPLGSSYYLSPTTDSSVPDRGVTMDTRGAGVTLTSVWNATATMAPWSDASVQNRTVIPMGSLVSLNYNLPTMIIVASVLFVVIVATAFGNFLVGLALFRYKYLRTISNYLIGNLAASDFLLATTILPLSTVNECLGHWVFGQAMCNFWLLTDVLYCTASIWNLCIIAFDRFTATLYPLWYREKRSNKQAAIYVALVWIIAAAICMPPLLGWNELSQNYRYDNETNVYRCMLFETPSYVAYSASGSFYIPFFITFFLYIRIFMVLHKRMKKMRNASRQHQARLQPNNANNVKPLLNNATRMVERDTVITTATVTNDGSGNTEELSSKSLFGSDSGDEVDEIEDSSTQTKSDHTFFQGGGADGKSNPKVKRNGTCDANKLGGNKGEVVAILNPRPCDFNHDASDTEKVKVAEQNQMKSAMAIVKVPNTAKTGDLSSSQALLSSTNNGMATSSVNDGGGGSVVAVAKAKNKKMPGALKKNTFFSKQPKKKLPSSQKRKYEQREMRATIRMAIIIAVFCGMWLGFFTTYFIKGFCSGCFIPRELEAIFFWLGYSNSSVNPILYTIFNEEFRRAFQKILGCYRKGSSHRGRR